MQMLPWQIKNLKVTNADLFTAGEWRQSADSAERFDMSCHAYITLLYNLIHSPVL